MYIKSVYALLTNGAIQRSVVQSYKLSNYVFDHVIHQWSRPARGTTKYSGAREPRFPSLTNDPIPLGRCSAVENKTISVEVFCQFVC